MGGRYDVILPASGHSGLTLSLGQHADSTRTAAVVKRHPEL